MKRASNQYHFSKLLIFLTLFHFLLFQKAHAAPLTSMNLHQEIHLSDINGTAAVSSHYVGSEATTTKPLKLEALIR